MITNNPMQLKAFIKKKASEKNISAQLVMQNYMMERFLERISLSKYKENFILKGGFLIAAIVGLDSRATMDLDATIKGLSLTHEIIKNIFNDICHTDVNDDVTFSILKISDIRISSEYPGIRVNLEANYFPLKVPFTVDITTGDKITPREIEYSFNLMFDERSISILAYNLETILAEKLETILSRNIANTRARDFYDIYIIFKLRGTEYNSDVLKTALNETSNKRGSHEVLRQYESIIARVIKSNEMHNLWATYQNEFDYAKGIEFSDICKIIIQIMNTIGY